MKSRERLAEALRGLVGNECFNVFCNHGAVVDIQSGSPLNNFRLAKCDTRFISSGSRGAVYDIVQVSVMA